MSMTIYGGAVPLVIILTLIGLYTVGNLGRQFILEYGRKKIKRNYLKEFVTYVYANRDFYYPKFIQGLLACNASVLFAWAIDHSMFKEIVIWMNIVIPCGIFIGVLLQWISELKLK
jgi:hypothetical protein